MRFKSSGMDILIPSINSSSSDNEAPHLIHLTIADVSLYVILFKLPGVNYNLKLSQNKSSVRAVVDAQFLVMVLLTSMEKLFYKILLSFDREFSMLVLMLDNISTLSLRSNKIPSDELFGSDSFDDSLVSLNLCPNESIPV